MAKTFGNSKGQSQLVTHSILVLFAILLLLAVANSMNKISEQYEEFSINISVKGICSLIKSAAEKIRIPVSKEINMDRTEEMGYSLITLPDKIGNTYYTIRMDNGEIIIETEKNTYYCSIGLNSTLSGMSYGGKTRIKWLFGNGTDSIVIENA